jgi:hypothetical protein
MYLLLKPKTVQILALAQLFLAVPNFGWAAERCSLALNQGPWAAPELQALAARGYDIESVQVQDIQDYYRYLRQNPLFWGLIIDTDLSGRLMEHANFLLNSQNEIVAHDLSGLFRLNLGGSRLELAISLPTCEQLRGKRNTLELEGLLRKRAFQATPLIRLLDDNVQTSKEPWGHLILDAELLATATSVKSVGPKLEDLHRRYDEIVRMIPQAVAAGQLDGWVERVQRDILHTYNSDYCRNYPALSDLVNGGIGCGNCVANALLAIAATQDAGVHLPTGWQFAARMFGDHIEAVIYNPQQQKIRSLATGQEEASRSAFLFRPEMLLWTTLKGIHLNHPFATAGLGVILQDSTLYGPLLLHSSDYFWSYLPIPNPLNFLTTIMDKLRGRSSDFLPTVGASISFMWTPYRAKQGVTAGSPPLFSPPSELPGPETAGNGSSWQWFGWLRGGRSGNADNVEGSLTSKQLQFLRNISERWSAADRAKIGLLRESMELTELRQTLAPLSPMDNYNKIYFYNDALAKDGEPAIASGPLAYVQTLDDIQPAGPLRVHGCNLAFKNQSEATRFNALQMKQRRDYAELYFRASLQNWKSPAMAQDLGRDLGSFDQLLRPEKFVERRELLQHLTVTMLQIRSLSNLAFCLPTATRHETFDAFPVMFKGDFYVIDQNNIPGLLALLTALDGWAQFLTQNHRQVLSFLEQSDAATRRWFRDLSEAAASIVEDVGGRRTVSPLRGLFLAMLFDADLSYSVPATADEAAKESQPNPPPAPTAPGPSELAYEMVPMESLAPEQQQQIRSVTLPVLRQEVDLDPEILRHILRMQSRDDLQNPLVQLASMPFLLRQNLYPSPTPSGGPHPEGRELGRPEASHPEPMSSACRSLWNLRAFVITPLADVLAPLHPALSSGVALYRALPETTQFSSQDQQNFKAPAFVGESCLLSAAKPDTESYQNLQPIDAPNEAACENETFGDRSVVEINDHLYEYNSNWKSSTEIWRLKVDDRGWRYATFIHDSRMLQAFIPAANCH